MKRVSLLTQIHNIIVSQTFPRSFLLLRFRFRIFLVIWNVIKYNLKIDLNVIKEKIWKTLLSSQGTFLCYSFFFFFILPNQPPPLTSLSEVVFIRSILLACALAETFNHFKKIHTVKVGVLRRKTVHVGLATGNVCKKKMNKKHTTCEGKQKNMFIDKLVGNIIYRVPGLFFAFFLRWRNFSTW